MLKGQAGICVTPRVVNDGESIGYILIIRSSKLSGWRLCVKDGSLGQTRRTGCCLDASA